MVEPVHSPPSPDRSLLVPLAFWACLLAAALLFASVALAPKIVAWQELDLETIEQQQQLLMLEQQLQHLEKVVYSLEHDKRFQAEVARREIGGYETGTEIIPVAPALRVDVRLPRIESPNVPLVVPWYVPILRTLATPTDWRRRVLWTAAGFCLVAFTLLRDRDP